MPTVKIYKMDGSVAGEMQLSDKIFAGTILPTATFYSVPQMLFSK